MHVPTCVRVTGPSAITPSPPLAIVLPQNTFAQLAAVGGGASGAAPAGEAAEQPAVAAPAGAGTGGEESEGFGAPATGGGGGGSGAVQNLGVVGRGTKRINLQPVQVCMRPRCLQQAAAQPTTAQLHACCSS